MQCSFRRECISTYRLCFTSNVCESKTYLAALIINKMNYEGRVSSVNGAMWTFELDNKIIVHLGHLAAQNEQQFLPEIGEHVRIYNAHFMANKYYKVSKLFLCEKSVFSSDGSEAYTREEALLKLITDCNLGVSDLLEIDYNIAVINDSITCLTQESSEIIIFEIIRSIANCCTTILNSCNDTHRCLNRTISPFTLKTVSNCHYIDLEQNKELKGPPWSFGTHSHDKSTMLVGYLKVNKRFGIILLHDSKYKMPCVITTRNQTANKLGILNKIVIIRKYRILTEMYRDLGAPHLEYIVFDVEDVIVLNNVKPINTTPQEVLFKKLPTDFPYVHDFEFKLQKKAAVSVDKDYKIECWLDVLITNKRNNHHIYPAYLGLNAYQVQLAALLKENETYLVYHCEKLKDWKNFELARLKDHPVSKRFVEKTAIFVCGQTKSCSEGISNPVLSVTEAIETIQTESKSISFQGLISIKKFTPALSSRTQKNVTCAGFGTPGTHTHTLIFMDDTQEHNLLLYLNNWENLQIPLGLIPYMRVHVRNALPQKKKYLKSSSMTTLEVLSYEPAIPFNTANLSSHPGRECEKYVFLGWGDLIPCNVLVWARTVQLYLRSLRIMFKCKICESIVVAQAGSCCAAPKLNLETSITLFVQDQMGRSLIISKSTELLRLLLDLEPQQWNNWCHAFEDVGEYVHDNEQSTSFSSESNSNIFCEAIALSLNILNAMKICKLELQCRKMESSMEDNEGMPKWFCVDARRCEEELLL